MPSSLPQAPEQPSLSSLAAHLGPTASSAWSHCLSVNVRLLPLLNSALRPRLLALLTTAELLAVLSALHSLYTCVEAASLPGSQLPARPAEADGPTHLVRTLVQRAATEQLPAGVLASLSGIRDSRLAAQHKQPRLDLSDAWLKALALALQPAAPAAAVSSSSSAAAAAASPAPSSAGPLPLHPASAAALSALLTQHHAAHCIGPAQQAVRAALTASMQALVNAVVAKTGRPGQQQQQQGRRGGGSSSGSGGGGGGGGGSPPPSTATVHCFGSSASGFGAASSDCDLVVLIQGPLPPTLLYAALARQVWRSSEYDQAHTQVVRRARVPIIRLRHRASGLAMDVQVAHSLPLHNTALLASYCALEPRLPCLGAALKHWAGRRQLSDSSSGTLSSYAWVLLAIFYLQQARQLPCLQAPATCQAVQAAGGCVVAATVEGRRLVYANLAARCGGRAPSAQLAAHFASTLRSAREEAAAAAAAAAAAGGDSKACPGVALFVRLWGAAGFVEAGQGVAELLAGFFAYYTTVATAQGLAVSVRTGGFLPRDTFSGALAALGEEWREQEEEGEEEEEEGEGEEQQQGAGGAALAGGGAAAAAAAAPPPPSKGKGKGKATVPPTPSFAIEDPFELEHNLSRVVKPAGAARIALELARAVALLQPLAAGEPAGLAAAQWEALVQGITPEQAKQQGKGKAAGPAAASAGAQAGGGGGGGGGGIGGGKAGGRGAAASKPPAGLTAQQQQQGLTRELADGRSPMHVLMALARLQAEEAADPVAALAAGLQAVALEQAPPPAAQTAAQAAQAAAAVERARRKRDKQRARRKAAAEAAKGKAGGGGGGGHLE